ncbi:MAG: preprotein translocase subunit SecA [Firmicutes bacterium]|nr:preprotein translocase subunit SecA [Bacillota bacterium]
MLGLLKNLVGNEREIRRLWPLVEKVNSLEQAVAKIPMEQYPARTVELKERLARGEPLDQLLPEAFALAREASRNTVGMRPFDVQVMGGVVLHQGRVAEMKTGEGKTLVAVLPTYLNALTGKGVHIVTVNDYLARRDSEWMGPIYRALGLEVGLILHGLSHSQRYAAYRKDITYGTNSEIGFDFLRDNMVVQREQIVQKALNYAIVDEVDCILIDEARTPLIISGQARKSTDLYHKFARLIPRLREEEDYTVDEKAHTVVPTEAGTRKAEKLLGVKNIFDDSNLELSHHFTQALKAQALMKRDHDYVVKDGQVIIVDEFTGRMMFGRRYSEGLHQAIEAKEGLRVERESQTLATITYQNFFRMYQKLAGMTGTAATEEEEFRKIYGMDVVVVPTHKPMIREDLPDVIYKTRRAKFKAVVDDICERHDRGQPVLVGTITIERSEELSRFLKQRGVTHQVLNAKHHEREAEIVALAGQHRMVTIATNMAGRGTDIVLGPEVPGLGGLHIIGTERHESRRIDNQLRGRSGRQGDPGSSQFYLSLDDDLLRLFGGDHIRGLMDRLGVEEEMPIDHPLITKAIENAQRRVEGHNFDIRRQVLQYDDVMNKHRELIYRQRRKILESEGLRESVREMLDEVAGQIADRYASSQVHPEEWDLDGLISHAENTFLLPGSLNAEELAGLSAAELRDHLKSLGHAGYVRRETEFGPEILAELERVITLRVVDDKWMDHLDAMDQLRQGIGLRAYGQRDPLIEYRFEAYEMFQNMVNSIQEDVVRYLLRVQVSHEGSREETPGRPATVVEGGAVPVAGGPSAARGSATRAGGGHGAWNSRSDAPAADARNKPGRNDPCPCGSGKKYKRCCGV